MKTLKALTTIAVAALALASCQQEKDYAELAPGRDLVRASRELSTRSFLEADNSGETTTYTVFWNAPDEILVTYAGATPATFKSVNEEPATEATFKGTLPSPAGTKLYGIYPAESGNLVDAEGNFKIRFHDEQTAVAGTYDPDACPAVAVSDAKDLAFYNVCGLLALSVGYENVSKITLVKGPVDAPDFPYVPKPTAPDADPDADPEADAAGFPGGILTVAMDEEPSITDATETVSSITLLPPDGEEFFAIGETYYMAVPPGDIPEGVTFLVNVGGEDIPFTIPAEAGISVGRAKVHDVPTFYMGKIESVPALEEVWSMDSDGSEVWTNQITAVSVTHPDGYGMVRSLAMDDQYIYLPKSSAYPAIAAVSIADPTVQVAGNVSTIETGTTVTFATSCARMIKNTDPAINGGQDVLLVCSLKKDTADGVLTVYAYTSGISAAPVILCRFAWDSVNNIADWRRYGDRFCVTGTWQDGKLYFPSYNAEKTVIISVANGERTGVTQIAAPGHSAEGVKDITVYPGDETYIMVHNNSIGEILEPTGGTESHGWNEYSLYATYDGWIPGTWGYNFFTFNGFKCFTDVYISGNGSLELMSDKGSLFDCVSTAEYYDSYYFGGSAGSFADCCVREIDGETYVAALTQNGGLALFKIIMRKYITDDDDEPLPVDPSLPSPRRGNHR